MHARMSKIGKRVKRVYEPVQELTTTRWYKSDPNASNGFTWTRLAHSLSIGKIRVCAINRIGRGPWSNEVFELTTPVMVIFHLPISTQPQKKTAVSLMAE